jgi:hypothetical protein
MPEEQLAVRHQPIPYPCCWSTCHFCCRFFYRSHVFPYRVPVLPLRALYVAGSGYDIAARLTLVVEVYDTGHLFQVEPGFISPVKTQANPLGGWWALPGCRRCLLGCFYLGALLRGRGASTRVRSGMRVF